MSKDEGRGSLGSYSGFGLNKSNKAGSAAGKKKDDDDLDDLISDMAFKRGIEVQQQKPDRAKSEARPQLGQKSKFKTSLDPWDRDTFDDLEDNDNKKGKASGMGLGMGIGASGGRQPTRQTEASREMAEKRRALFGLDPKEEEKQAPRIGASTTKSQGGRMDKD